MTIQNVTIIISVRIAITPVTRSRAERVFDTGIFFFCLAVVAQFVHARSPLPHTFPSDDQGTSGLVGRSPCKSCDGARPRSCPRSGTLSHAKRPSGAYGVIAKRPYA